MNAKLLHTIPLSLTMTSFLIPGLANLNHSYPQANAGNTVSHEPAFGDYSLSTHVYVPLIKRQPEYSDVDLNPVVTSTPEQPAQPTPLLPEPTATATPVVKLPMESDFHSQRWETSTKNACGPTALLMVLDYYGENKTLPEVIRSFKFSPDQGGFDPDCEQNPVCLSAGALQQIAQSTYNMSVISGDGWTFDQVYESLQNGQPVIADVTWRLVPGGTGHFVVIYGIDRENKLVYYHDPFEGADQSASWDEFSASWNGPVDAGDPLQPSGHNSWAMSVRPN